MVNIKACLLEAAMPHNEANSLGVLEKQVAEVAKERTAIGAPPLD